MSLGGNKMQIDKLSFKGVYRASDKIFTPKQYVISEKIKNNLTSAGVKGYTFCESLEKKGYDVLITPVNGDKVDVSGVPCLGLCSIDWEFSKAPYVKVDDTIIKEATVEKVLSSIEEKIKA